MSRDKGFSLVELLLVITIIGIGAGIATLNFNRFIKKANIEKQTKELHSDLNDARMKSIYLKRRHSLVMQPSSYVFKDYSSENEDRSAGRTVFEKTFSYQYTKISGSSIADRIIEFDIRGLTNDVDTIGINPAYSGAAYDCLTVSKARTNIGKTEKSGSDDVCNQK